MSADNDMNSSLHSSVDVRIRSVAGQMDDLSVTLPMSASVLTLKEKITALHPAHPVILTLPALLPTFSLLHKCLFAHLNSLNSFYSLKTPAEQRLIYAGRLLAHYQTLESIFSVCSHIFIFLTIAIGRVTKLISQKHWRCIYTQKNRMNFTSRI